jgi:4-hydroxy-4-methyl-2-oxoglutarate aldolase
LDARFELAAIHAILEPLPVMIHLNTIYRSRILTIGLRLTFTLAFILSFATSAYPQLGMLSTEQRISLTRAWKGERFPDGRPKVPDSILAGLKKVDAEEALEELSTHGYEGQFEGGWRELNPGGRMVGRVFTAVFMPLRPDVNSFVNDNGKAAGHVGGQNTWLVDLLSPGDVLVVDMFGKIKEGAFADDKLATAIFAKSRNGLVVDGAVRGATNISDLRGIDVFARDFDPSALNDAMLMGINVPIRIGQTTVLPGDVAVSDVEGITFIPPQFAQEVVDFANMIQPIDEWGHQMLREHRYNPGQIDGEWSKQMIHEYNLWLEHKGLKQRMPEK